MLVIAMVCSHGALTLALFCSLRFCFALLCSFMLCDSSLICSIFLPALLPTALMYPSLLDHDSPFSLGAGTSAGLSYTLLGNNSAYLYFVIGRALVVRLPVAFFPADTPAPPVPYPPTPSPLNPLACEGFEVAGAGREYVNGIYKRTLRQVSVLHVCACLRVFARLRVCVYQRTITCIVLE